MRPYKYRKYLVVSTCWYIKHKDCHDRMVHAVIEPSKIYITDPSGESRVQTDINSTHFSIHLTRFDPHPGLTSNKTLVADDKG